jgi:bis(5'-nucleosidyl)-tetraphosphatase
VALSSLHVTNGDESVKRPLSCGFLIVRGDPISAFLLMEHPDRLDLPKGHVDPGESDLECALRELEEETGITDGDIEVVEDFVYETNYPVSGRRYGGGGIITKTLRIFLGRLLTDLEIEVSEHDGHRWVDWNPPHRIQERVIDPLLAQLAGFESDHG